jgi:hypothetical protein
LPTADEKQLSSHDRDLVNAASAILDEPAVRGATVSQATLARRLRATAHTIGGVSLHYQALDSTT